MWKGEVKKGALGPVPTLLLAGVVAYGVWQVVTAWRQTLQTKEVDPALQQEIDLVRFAQSEEVNDLFQAFDTNHDGKVDLAELTAGLRTYKPDAATEAVRASALDIMLLFDRKNNKQLEKDEFQAFIQSWCLGTGTEFEQLTHQLKEHLADKQYLAEEVKEAVQEFEGASQKEVEALLDRHKLQSIFRMWDTDDDELVDQRVLEHALKRLVTLSSSNMAPDKRQGVQEFLDVMGGTSYIAGQTVDQELMPNLTGDSVRTIRHLTLPQFISFVQSFQEVSGLPRAQITDFLVILPLYKKTAAEGRKLPKEVQALDQAIKEHEVLSPLEFEYGTKQ